MFYCQDMMTAININFHAMSLVCVDISLNIK